MMFWSLTLVIAVIAAAALYYAGAGRRVNAQQANAERAHFQRQLAEIESDMAEGRLGETEGQAAKAELAREVLRTRDRTVPSSRPLPRLVVGVAALSTALLALGTYAVIGRPDLPAQPLAERERLPEDMTVEEAVARVEKALAANPDDLRGWQAIMPIYLRMGRYDDAARALRRIIDLDGATADRESDLGEVLTLANDNVPTPEALDLLRSAVARDPTHVRARYMLAAEAMRTGDYAAAKPMWEDLLDGAPEDAPWLEAARSGLEAAEQGIAGIDTGVDQEAIRGMVDGLEARLTAEGGSIEEWTRLVRSRLVLGETDKAQALYEQARAAYPDAGERIALDVLAADNGLLANDP